MSHSKKAKAAGVSASSFFDLKSELAKQESEFAKNKAVGKTYIAGGVQRAEKKPTVWAKSNKGVKSRIERDMQMEQLSKQTVESTREALERKAKIYDKLRKGKTGGLNEAQYGELLVDFDAKAAVDGHWSSDSEDIDESLTVPKPPEHEEDPLVEYEDEFGRVRTSRRSEVPREVLERKRQEEERVDDDPFVVYNPTNHFPVYEPSAERLAAIREAASEAANPIETHYDASREVRAKGAAFYAFSSDEQKRQQELEELRKARLETEQARKESGAMDVKSGEVEGMVAGPSNVTNDGSVSSVKSRAVEKRKREIEERRRLLEEKRKKLRGSDESKAGPEIAKATPNSLLAPSTHPYPPSTDPFAMLENASQRSTQTIHSLPQQVPSDDPFAKLEARGPEVSRGEAKPSLKGEPASGRKVKKRRDDRQEELRLNSADAFLQELEKDLTGMR